VVDGDAETRSALAGMAKVAGYRLIEAENAAQAFEALAEQEAGIILCEQNLDDMSGVEFLGRVRFMYPATVRIMLAAGVDAAVATSAINQGGVFKVLQKPWKQSELSVILDAAFVQYESDARMVKSV
jgi:DNA-binding NtrC family response regulator